MTKLESIHILQPGLEPARARHELAALLRKRVHRSRTYHKLSRVCRRQRRRIGVQPRSNVDTPITGASRGAEEPDRQHRRVEPYHAIDSGRFDFKRVTSNIRRPRSAHRSILPPPPPPPPPGPPGRDRVDGNGLRGRVVGSVHVLAVRRRIHRNAHRAGGVRRRLQVERHGGVRGQRASIAGHGTGTEVQLPLVPVADRPATPAGNVNVRRALVAVSGPRLARRPCTTIVAP